MPPLVVARTLPSPAELVAMGDPPPPQPGRHRQQVVGAEEGPAEPGLADLGPRAERLADLRTVRVGLDLRYKDLEDRRRRVHDTQRKLNEKIDAYAALRCGLQAELGGLGRAGEALGASLDEQGRQLQRQAELLRSERLARDTLRDEAQRLRELALSQPVREGAAALEAGLAARRPASGAFGSPAQRAHRGARRCCPRRRRTLRRCPRVQALRCRVAWRGPQVTDGPREREESGDFGIWWST
ncbi:unnamed protein product [Prorocentrum cordatum]|uniref:Uncharacterized protein n=1 Tax=Prorocentrum cordatum TaxID=2364126 RepID=A0ABN9UHV0_9DINO|nr:unnamed protein product [Polarella glacialis]